MVVFIISKTPFNYNFEEFTSLRFILTSVHVSGNMKQQISNFSFNFNRPFFVSAMFF